MNFLILIFMLMFSTVHVLEIIGDQNNQTRTTAKGGLIAVDKVPIVTNQTSVLNVSDNSTTNDKSTKTTNSITGKELTKTVNELNSTDTKDYKKMNEIEDHTKPVFVRTDKGYIYLIPSSSSTNLPNSILILFVCFMFRFFL